MNKRDRQRYDSEVLMIWCMLGIGAVIMIILFWNLVMDILHHFKK
jgi:hypothetical protein